MILDKDLQRIQFLMENERYDQALKLLYAARASNPEMALFPALIATCLAHTDQLREALKEIEHSVGLEPDNCYYHFERARILFLSNKNPQALEAIETALRIDSEDASFHALRGQIFKRMKQWDQARLASLRALELDPENEAAQPCLAFALQQLGQGEEASKAMLEAMKHNPESSYTMASQGNILMFQKKYKEAAVFFREALKLDPHCEPARYGIIEVLKAKNPFYRVVLRFNLWISKFSGNMVFAAIFIAWFLTKILRNLAKQYPSLEPYVTPILTVYLLVVAYLWFCDPISQFLLRLNRDGKYFLTPMERRGATLTGIWLSLSIICGAFGFYLSNQVFIFLTFGFLLLILPFHEAYGEEQQHPKLYFSFAWAMAALVFLWFGLIVAQSPLQSLVLWTFVIGLVAFQWGTVILQARR